MVIRRQFAFSVQPDFVQHSAEIEKAAHFVVRTAELHLTPPRIQFVRFPAWFKCAETNLSSRDPSLSRGEPPDCGSWSRCPWGRAQTISPILQGRAGSSPSSRF